MALLVVMEALLLGGVALCLVLALYAWRQETAPASRYFSVSLFAVAIYALSVALEFMTPSLDGKVLWSKIQYIPGVSLAPLWLFFAIVYGNHQAWITRRRIVLIWIVPALSLVLAATNEWHHLIWTNVSLVQGTSSGFAAYKHGPAIWVLMWYSYGLMAVASLILIRQAFQTATMYQSQTIALVCGALLPWIGNVISVTGLGPLQGFELAALTFIASGALFSWGIRRFHLFQMTPVAYDTILASMSEAVVIVDENSRIAYLNSAAEQLLGIKRNHMGMPLQTLGPIGARLADAEDGTTVLDENPHGDSLLPSRCLEVVATDLKTTPRHARNKLLILRDITEREHAEQERHNLEAQLAQAQKMESVGRLAAGVAHDFNNLLAVILGYAEMALAHAEGLHPRVRESFQHIEKAGERARDLTRQMLAFGRRQTLEVRVLDLNEVIGRLGEMIARLIGEDIKVITLLNPDIGAVKADATQIEQILLNLAVNARDAMPNGGRLTIETADVVLDEAYAATHPDVQPGAYVMLAVSDTGCGMDPDTLKMAFEPFFTTKGVGRGTGLGLSTVHGIVKQHGGHISVYSEVGQGTTLKIYLPRVTEAKEDGVAPSAAAVSIQGTETILVVEDDEEVRLLACSMLKGLGYDVLEAEDGRVAVRLAAERERIHMLLTDVIMPTMSGPEVFAEVARLQPNIRVLYVSGYTGNVIAHHGILDEGVHLLQKPFTVQALSQKIRQVLAG